MNKELDQAIKELSDAFISDKRADGSTFYKISDDAPDWCKGYVHNGQCLMLRVHSAIDDRLPDDWIYNETAGIAQSFGEYTNDTGNDLIEHCTEIADGRVDCYSTELTKWLALHLGNLSLCDEAAEEMGLDDKVGIIDRIKLGQFMALERIARTLADAVIERAEELENATA